MTYIHTIFKVIIEVSKTYTVAFLSYFLLKKMETRKYSSKYLFKYRSDPEKERQKHQLLLTEQHANATAQLTKRLAVLFQCSVESRTYSSLRVLRILRVQASVHPAGGTSHHPNCW